MCQTIHYRSALCGHHWLQISRPCYPGIGFNNCPFLRAGAQTGTAQDPTPEVTWPGGGFCPACQFGGGHATGSAAAATAYSPPLPTHAVVPFGTVPGGAPGVIQAVGGGVINAADHAEQQLYVDDRRRGSRGGRIDEEHQPRHRRSRRGSVASRASGGESQNTSMIVHHQQSPYQQQPQQQIVVAAPHQVQMALVQPGYAYYYGNGYGQYGNYHGGGGGNVQYDRNQIRMIVNMQDRYRWGLGPSKKDAGMECAVM